jgi:prepilin-type N-terminal cleavage/methylation domain-containing protein
MNTKKGFTLMELLVVVAIIGILASVVIAVLGTGKKKGEDSAVQSNLHTVINQAELFQTDNGNSYLPAGGSTFGIAACPVYNASGTNMFQVNKVVADAIAEATIRGNGNACYNSSTQWAIAVGLKLNSGTSWCIDNAGASRQVNSAPASAINAGTFTCN